MLNILRSHRQWKMKQSNKYKSNEMKHEGTQTENQVHNLCFFVFFESLKRSLQFSSSLSMQYKPALLLPSCFTTNDQLFCHFLIVKQNISFHYYQKKYLSIETKKLRSLKISLQ